jgi:hypothetical protein
MIAVTSARAISRTTPGRSLRTQDLGGLELSGPVRPAFFARRRVLHGRVQIPKHRLRIPKEISHGEGEATGQGRHAGPKGGGASSMLRSRCATQVDVSVSWLGFKTGEACMGAHEFRLQSET